MIVSDSKLAPYCEARQTKGIWMASRFMILRRGMQLSLLLVFLTGPLFDVWITKGTLASSLTFDVIPLTDAFVLLQSLAARHVPDVTALAGAWIVIATYWLLGGRSFCAWVCPINPVSDCAAWLRRKLDIRVSTKLRPKLRLYIIAGIGVTSFATGTIAWELVNPITAFHRAMIFGTGFGFFSVLAIFVFDLLIAKHGWCGHLCPVGAFYGLIGKVSLLRIAATRRTACDDCMSCFAVCPEPHVITPALRGEKTGHGPVILSGDCTVCGACIDSCPEHVFRFTHRFDRMVEVAGSPLSQNLLVLDGIERRHL